MKTPNSWKTVTVTFILNLMKDVSSYGEASLDKHEHDMMIINGERGWGSSAKCVCWNSFLCLCMSSIPLRYWVGHLVHTRIFRGERRRSQDDFSSFLFLGLLSGRGIVVFVIHFEGEKGVEEKRIGKGQRLTSNMPYDEVVFSELHQDLLATGT